jgi:hypothetical protein
VCESCGGVSPGASVRVESQDVYVPVEVAGETYELVIAVPAAVGRLDEVIAEIQSGLRVILPDGWTVDPKKRRK